MTPTPDRAVGRAAHTRADRIERDLLSRWPDAWTQMDQMRRHPPMPWPDWCLLPMAGAATVTGPMGLAGPPPIAQVAALYAWRYSRAVYLVEPSLMSRLLDQVPDHLELDAFTGLPHWCVYVASEDPDSPGGLWIHLEYDVATDRPELRLLVDVDDQLLPVPVYLDRSTLTEAIGDFRATTLATLASAREVVPGQNVRGGALDAVVAQFADRIDGYVALVAYLCRQEADVRCVDRPGLRPVRPRSPVRDRTVWAVGYSG